MKSDHTGFKRLYSSIIFSYQGLIATWKNEEAFRVEIYASILVLCSTPFIIDSHLELIALLGAIILVFICELFNSAVESLVDRIGDEYHELSGRAKDQGSASVAISLFFAGIVWLLVIIY